MSAWLLDTCVLIDLTRRIPAAELAVRTALEQPYVCPVSTMELFAGARSQREEAQVDVVLATFRQLPIPPEVYRLAGSYLRHFRASHSLSFPDALIAATAEHHGLRLATLNVKHFPMLPKLKRAY